jgi:hypothetical protein
MRSAAGQPAIVHFQSGVVDGLLQGKDRISDMRINVASSDTRQT